MSIITRYGGAAIAPTRFNAPDNLWSEWRVANAQIVSGGVESIPDSAGKGANNHLALVAGAVRASRTGNIAEVINSNTKYIVPALSLPPGLKDMTLVFVINPPSGTFGGARWLWDYAPPAGGASSASVWAQTGAFQLRSSDSFYNSYANCSMPAGWATMAFSVQRSKGYQVEDIYVNGVNAVTSRLSANVSGTFAAGLPFYLLSALSGNAFVAGKITAARLYVGFMSPAEILAASTEVWNQNTPTT